MSLSLHDLYCVYLTASGGDPAGGPGKRMITVGSVPRTYLLRYMPQRSLIVGTLSLMTKSGACVQVLK